MISINWSFSNMKDSTLNPSKTSPYVCMLFYIRDSICINACSCYIFVVFVSTCEKKRWIQKQPISINAIFQEDDHPYQLEHPSKIS